MRIQEREYDRRQKAKRRQKKKKSKVRREVFILRGVVTETSRML
jgi:hypothetical protein